MRTPITRPERHELPTGFVDGNGLDDDSIPVKPFVIGCEIKLEDEKNLETKD